MEYNLDHDQCIHDCTWLTHDHGCECQQSFRLCGGCGWSGYGWLATHTAGFLLLKPASAFGHRCAPTAHAGPMGVLAGQTCGYLTSWLCPIVCRPTWLLLYAGFMPHCSCRAAAGLTAFHLLAVVNALDFFTLFWLGVALPSEPVVGSQTGDVLCNIQSLTVDECPGALQGCCVIHWFECLLATVL